MKKRYLPIIIGFVYFFLLLLLIHSEKQVDGATITNLWDAIWYSFVTLSTVGYGDFYPVSNLGKLIGLVFVFSSLGVLGYLISQLTVKLTKYMEDKKNGHFGTKMENHIVIIGFDKFAKYILEQIVTTGIKVAVVTDKKEDIDTLLLNYNQKEVFGLYTDIENFENLEKINITKAAKVFINFTDDTEMLVYILNLKNHFKDLDIVVSLNNASFKKTFKSAGVLYAVSREEIAAKLVASYILSRM